MKHPPRRITQQKNSTRKITYTISFERNVGRALRIAYKLLPSHLSSKKAVSNVLSQESHSEDYLCSAASQTRNVMHTGSRQCQRQDRGGGG